MWFQNGSSSGTFSLLTGSDLLVVTRLTQDAGIEYPIICGAMYPCSNPELVAAASEGGGIAIVQPVSLTMAVSYTHLTLPTNREV